MKTLQVSAALCGLVLLGGAVPAGAATGALEAFVLRTLVTGNGNYGGCMAQMSVAISAASPPTSCTNNWVSFSCTGTYTGKDLAFTMFDQAQLALSLNKKVRVDVDDAKKHNGVCFAYRVDVIK